MNKKLTKQQTKGGNSSRTKTLAHQIYQRKQICQARARIPSPLTGEGDGEEGREVTSHKEKD
jgi:hypothetical protein